MKTKLTLFFLSLICAISLNAQISFVSPAGGEQWEIGSTHDVIINNLSATAIEWPMVMAEWAGGSDYVAMPYSIEPGINTFSWTINPSQCDVASDYTIHIYEGSEIAVSNQFEVVAALPQITAINNPSNGDYWFNGNSYSISFQCLSVSSVNIYYSTDGSTDWQLITSNFSTVDGYNNYSWDVSGIIGANPNSKIKIESEENNTIYILSTDFTLAEVGLVSFVSPAGGEQWEIGSTHNVIVNSLSATTIEWPYSIAEWSGGDGSINFPSIEPGLNTFSWTIDPSQFDIASDYTIRIYDGSEVIAVSNQFEVIAALPEITAVTNPNNGSLWFNGNSYSISFQCLSVSSANIYYSTDGSTNWQLITSNFSTVDGYNNYSWNVSGVIGTHPNAKIKIESVANSSIYKLSADFTLAEEGLVSFITPAGGELWHQESAYNIEILNPSASSYNSCEIMIYGNGGMSQEYVSVQNLISGTNIISYTIPDYFYDATDYKIIVRDFNSNIIAVSNTFAIGRPISSIINPTTGDYWYNGNDFNVEWQSNGVSNVDIYYSLNGLDNWQTIVTNVASFNSVTNSYTWSVSGILGTNTSAKVKIVNSANSSEFLSSNSFTLAENSVFSFSSPVGGEIWSEGSTQTIEIQNASSSNYSSCSLVVSRLGNEVQIGSFYTIQPGLNSISWNINPNDFYPANDYSITLYNFSLEPIAVSNQFEITGTLEITEIYSPYASAIWYNLNDYSIYWASENVESVNIYYSLDGSTNWQTIATDVATSDGDNYYQWSVAGITGVNPNSKIKVVSAINSSVYNTSASFTLAETSPVAFVSPAGGEEWEQGSVQTIQINNTQPTAYNHCEIVAYWSDNNETRTISANYTLNPGLNSLSWTINPSFYDVDDDYTIMIIDENYNTLDQSSTFEVIEAQPQISEVGNPASDSYWYNGGSYYIDWTCLSVDEVNISYSLDGATNWQTIATNEESYDGYNNYLWSVAGITGVNPNSKIKVESSVNSSVLNTSADFTLAESSPLAFVSPAGGEEWEVASVQTIEINNLISTSFSNCIIIASASSIGLYETINNNFTFNPGNNSLSWTINPSFYDIADDYVLKIYDFNSNILCQSNEFKVIEAQPQISEVAYPEEDSYWFNGSNCYISWTSLNVDEVNISYSYDGSIWQTIATNVTSSDDFNIYYWSITGITGINPNSRIKVESSLNPDVFNTSSDFTLAESSPLAFVSPAGGEEWEIGSEQTIEINNLNSTIYSNCIVVAYWSIFSNETINYNFTFEPGINSLSWTINPYMYEISDNYVLKIFDENSNLLCQSNEFKVIAAHPQITEVGNPASDSYWYNGNVYYIEWICLSVSEVNISYSLDGETNWQTIATNEASYDGYNNYTWSLAGITDVNPNSKIKVESSINPDVFNTSYAFTLAETSPVAFVSPAGGEEWEIGSEQTIEINNLVSTSFNNLRVRAYWLGGGIYETINDNYTFEPGINSLSWTINPSFYEIADDYVLKIYDLNSNLLCQSNEFKVIAAQPQITEVGNPVSDSYWYNGNDYYIEWICLSVSEVNISYSLDGATNWQTIATNEASYDGYNNYLWSVAGITGVNPNSKIKVESSINSDLFKESAIFTLAESSPIAFVSPAGGEEWEMGSEQTIEINNASSIVLEDCQIAAYWGIDDYAEILSSYDFVVGDNEIIWEINPSVFDAETNYILVIYDQFGTQLAMCNEFSVIESDYIVLSSDDLSIASAANSEQTFSITANVSWTVSTSESWLTADPTSGSNNATITLTAQENNTGSLRTANVTVSDGNIVKTIVVTQDFMSSSSTVIADLISVYPNPNSGDFTISLNESGDYNLAIYNSLGQMVWSQSANMSEQQEYSVSGLVTGTYILKLVSEAKTDVLKIVIR